MALPLPIGLQTIAVTILLQALRNTVRAASCFESEGNTFKWYLSSLGFRTMRVTLLPPILKALAQIC